MSARSTETLDHLRGQIARLETGHARTHEMLPFGVPEIDRCLPGGGLAYGGLHEITGGGVSAVDGAAPALFAAGIAARTSGKVLWCLSRCDLFAPSLEQAGLPPDRLVIIEAGDEKNVLLCFEEALRHGGPSVVVAEVSRLSMLASRRLLLAAETSGTMAIAVRRFRRERDAQDFSSPTAATTRWKVTELPSPKLPVPGVARGRWQVELVRSRNQHTGTFILEATDEQGHVHLAADLANGQVAQTA